MEPLDEMVRRHVKEAVELLAEKNASQRDGAVGLGLYSDRIAQQTRKQPP